MKKRILCVLLASILLGTLSCGSGDVPQSDTTAGTTPAAEDTTGYLDTFGDKRFDGQTLTIAALDFESQPTIPPDEQDGEIVGDALYERDRTVEERLGITIQYRSYDDTERKMLLSDIRNDIAAMDGTYDVIITAMANGLSTLAPEGFLLDLNTLPSLALDEAWWSRSCREELTFNGKQYITAGPISLAYYYSPCIIAFNQRLTDEYQIPDLYEMVLDGKWTLEQFGVVTKDVANDVNADGVMRAEDDFFAFACDELTGQAFFIGCGGRQTAPGDDGEVELVMNSDRNVNILDKIISVVANDNMRLLTENVNPSDALVTTAGKKTWHFKNARTMLVGYNMSGIIAYLRDMEDDYGIIPMPKLDESQDEYLTYGSPWGPVGISVPVTCAAEKTEMVGTALEMMAWLSYTNVGPQMFNITLKEKISRDENSKIMLDMIYEDIFFDLNGIHNFAKSGNLLRTCAIGANANFSSGYAAILSAAEAELQALMDQYNDIE